MLPCVCLVIDHDDVTIRCEQKHEPLGECVTDLLTTFRRQLGSITEQAHANMEYMFYILEKQKNS